MSSTIPYIGSKISLISNSEIRYEGILYTINTQESTIALQSVKTFGTEGRKIPEIPPSSEIYDFIIFRGQDIKDLTVLEGAGGSSAAMAQDPAIMSMNQRPAGGPGKDGNKGAGKGMSQRFDKGGGGVWGQLSKGGGKESSGYGGKGDGWGKGGGKSDGWGKVGGKGKDDGWGKGRSDGGWGKGDGWGKSGGYSGGGYSGGGSYSMGGKGKDYGKGKNDKGGKSKGGKDDGKGYSKGKSKGDGYGKSEGKGGYGKSEGKGDKGRRSGGKAGTTASGAPVGELLPETNADAKKEFAEDFDVTASNTKFDKVKEADEKQILSGYNKTSSFFDNISCEATDRAADADRPKIDREKARQYDKETFGDTRRPPRPVGVRRGKGKGKSKGS